MQQAFFIPSRVCVFAFTSQFAVQAQTKASAAEATALVKKGIAFIKTNGKGQATLEISKQPG